MEIQFFKLFSYYRVFKLQLFIVVMFIVVTIVTVVQLNCLHPVVLYCKYLSSVVRSCAPCGVVLYSLVHLVVWCCTVLCTLWCGGVQFCVSCCLVLYCFLFLVVLCCTVLCTLWCGVVQSCAPCGVVLYCKYLSNVVQSCSPSGVVLYSVVHLVVWCCTVLFTFWCRVVQRCA